GRHGQLLGQRAGPAAADADLVAVLAQVTTAAQAARAVPAAEHGVPGHPAPDPAGAHVLAGRADHAAPLVADAHRVGGLAGLEVAQVTAEQLDVGPAQAGPLDGHDDLAEARPRRRDVLDLPGRGPGDDDRAHGALRDKAARHH